MEELSYNAIIGCVSGFIIGSLIGLLLLVTSVDNDAEEKDCVDFYKNNNYITEKCEVYKDKLEKSGK